MRVLLSTDDRFTAGHEPTDDDLAGLYAAPDRAGGRWLRCNMVTTLDGAANGPNGLSGTINTEADHVVFDLLRAVSHAVVVGAGTIRAEGYGRLELDERWSQLRSRLGLGDELPLVVVTGSGSVPDRLRDRSAPGGPVLLATRASAPHLEEARDLLGEDVLVCGEDDVDPGALLDALADRGWTQVLTEGGPSLVGTLLGAELLDEFCVTISPMVLGGEHPRIVGSDGSPHELELSVLLEEDGSLLGRWLTRR